MHTIHQMKMNRSLYKIYIRIGIIIKIIKFHIYIHKNRKFEIKIKDIKKLNQENNKIMHNYKLTNINKIKSINLNKFY
jgi:hypothetical protein